MAAKDKRDEPRKRFSNTQMLLGAAGLFLFIVGVKRGLRVDVPAFAYDIHDLERLVQIADVLAPMP